MQILLNKEVENIQWGLDANNPLVKIKCKDGSLFTAKSVIVTLSIGVLQERYVYPVDQFIQQVRAILTLKINQNCL